VEHGRAFSDACLAVSVESIQAAGSCYVLAVPNALENAGVVSGPAADCFMNIKITELHVAPNDMRGILVQIKITELHVVPNDMRGILVQIKITELRDVTKRYAWYSCTD
jgi:hypothetical protein